MSEIKLMVICTCAVLGPIPKTKKKLYFLVVHCAWEEQEKVFLPFSGWIADCFCHKSVVVQGLNA